MCIYAYLDIFNAYLCIFMHIYAWICTFYADVCMGIHILCIFMHGYACFMYSYAWMCMFYVFLMVWSAVCGGRHIYLLFCFLLCCLLLSVFPRRFSNIFYECVCDICPSFFQYCLIGGWFRESRDGRAQQTQHPKTCNILAKMGL